MNKIDTCILNEFYSTFKELDTYKDQVDVKETIKMIVDFLSLPEDQFKESYQDNFILSKMGQTHDKLMGVFLYNVGLARILEATICAKQLIYRNLYTSFVPYII